MVTIVRKGIIGVQKTALITGAAGGIGREFCREFSRRGYHLIIVGRSAQRLERMADALKKAYGIDVYTVAADLANPQAPQQIYEEVGMAGLSVDVLVNNAGFGQGGYFDLGEIATQQEMIAVNVAATTALSRMFLPQMLRRGRGKILNVASTGSFVPGPMNAVYCATKAYVLSLSEALWEETRGTGVAVCALCPGATRSFFAQRADMLSTPLFRYGVLSPVQVARAGYRALALEKPVTVVGLGNKAMIAATRFAPRTFSGKISGEIQRPHHHTSIGRYRREG